MPAPRQEFGNLAGWVVGDKGEDVAKVTQRVEAVELAGFDQRIHRGGATAPGIGPGEEIVSATDRDTAQGAFGRVVVEAKRPSSKQRPRAARPAPW